MRFLSWKNRGVLLLLLFLFIITLNVARGEVRAFFYSLSFPVQKLFWQAGDTISDFFSAIGNTAQLKEEQNSLLRENLALRQELIELEDMKRENAALRQAFDSKSSGEFTLLLVEIRGKEIGSDILLINKGRDRKSVV